MCSLLDNDFVYGLGSNVRGCLGLGHENVVKYPEIIAKLFEQKIQTFITGYDFVLAMNENNHVFSWGHNHRGQCGRDVTQSGVYLTPENISHLNDKNITYICCGRYHSLALTTGGQVYGWGCNSEGQVGCGDDDKNHAICSPVLIRFDNNYKIKSIFCSDFTSYAITIDGLVFSWGDTFWHQMGPNVSLSPDKSFETLMKALGLSTQGMGAFGQTKPVPKSDDTFQENQELRDKGYETLMTGLSGIASRGFDESSGANIDRLIEGMSAMRAGGKYPLESHFKSLFTELSAIGSGGFGTVFKVKHRLDEQIYAVKRVQIKKSTDQYMKQILNEVKNLRKLRSEYVVQYYSSWVEGNALYIQMEFCSQNLRNILELKPQVFGRQSGEPMDFVDIAANNSPNHRYNYRRPVSAPEVISPCMCEHDTTEYYAQPVYNIRCPGVEEYDLAQVFEDTSRSLMGADDKYFNEFVLNNTSIKHLPQNVFSDLTFRVIRLDGAYSLSYISVSIALWERLERFSMNSIKYFIDKYT
ncbi:unnamed protein product [Oppiella nova]|uniref:Protein kinase domain-containing protein n=1 Tax=Oppiella nova TaxID=334625 RepID=A0A7R9QIQ0_9ACAR|nr:unnamed protein product [Oppiella nova]CAG2166536.1 unnamed protein product [Oppiella nova]